MGGKGLHLVFPDSPEKYAPNSLGVALIIVLLASVAFGVLEWYIVYYAFLSSSMLSANIVIALISHLAITTPIPIRLEQTET